ncbi:hypothetical protein ACP2AV_12460 [Aliiroseovarius sp. PTFE2010]|uniref:hypothetical protein n=1 Tax=Aliiroseovarius sp. PTFE2010 TaxID=3417190 RepID=UPI003CEB74DD
MSRINWRNFSLTTKIIWAFLAFEIMVGLVDRNYLSSFVASLTLIISLVPLFFARRFGVELPRNFMSAAVIFVFATLFLGEIEDFYNRFWWWDVVLHAGSAIGFGLIGFLAMFMLFQGDRYAAPAWAIGLFAFCFAMAIGALWEIFEFAMDQTFGMNMQKSGLPDTMKDLIVDAVGALIGATAGVVYLIRQRGTPFSGTLREFIARNNRFFDKSNRRK